MPPSAKEHEEPEASDTEGSQPGQALDRIYDDCGVVAHCPSLSGSPRFDGAHFVLSIAAIYLIWRPPGQKIDFDRATLALSITVLRAPLTGLNTALGSHSKRSAACREICRP